MDAIWTYNAICALLAAHEMRLEGMAHPRKKPKMWKKIAEELKDLEIVTCITYLFLTLTTYPLLLKHTSYNNVLDDVTGALLNPKILSSIFDKTTLIGIPRIRTTLEQVVLSSIMRLDKDSMDKLFDLMIMIVKYQLSAATGPREVILLTLNHLDAIRDMVTDESARECIGLVHQMVVDLYGNMTMEDVWQARKECLEELDTYKVRVSILLRLGLQNNDTSFNHIKRNYNEDYKELRDTLKDLKLNRFDGDSRFLGSFDLFGDRVTSLGKNIYSSSCEMMPKSGKHNLQFAKDCGTKAELGMLAAQLGTEEALKRPFTLNLFVTENTDNLDSNNDNYDPNANLDMELTTNEKVKQNKEYKEKLDNIYADFFEDDQNETKVNMNLLDLLDEIE
ncbi:protein OSCP1 isoform X2 [Cephus cinctus]|uniref:Protein OSCP1 isoform X2 n=1 Tax=Cephus cinctus TaxID=211228 RepID=A0AAJ7RID0_CEPCN|nr:protein OSCP1 isoform X2 [Cephus cinctus]